MSDPLISVVIPTYKRNVKLRRAIDSVIEQTYSNLEVIVVDDDPESDIQSILTDTFDGDIKYIQHEENEGAPIARNAGILNAEGKYIALLDDDDQWKPKKLELQMDKFENSTNDVGLVYTGRDVKKGDDTIKTDIPKKEGYIHSDLLYKNVIPSETPLIRRECFSKVGLFDPEFPSCQDLDLWIRIARKYKIAVVSKSLAISHEGHVDRISNDMGKKYHGHKKLIKKHKELFESNHLALARQYKQIGIFALRLGKKTIGIKYFLLSTRFNPKDYTLPLYFMANLAPDPFRASFAKTKIFQEHL